MNWHKKADELLDKLLSDENYSWTKLYADMEIDYPEIKHSAIRGYLRKTPKYIKAHEPDISERPIGVIGDLHIPFDHPNYLDFLKDTFKRFNVGQVVIIGDLVDNHALSLHPTETCAKSACDELDMAIAEVRKYVKAFPKVKMCIGNHDTNIERKAATVGIDRRFLKTRHQLLELPETWEIADEFIIDGVLYKHGINCCGKDGALNTALQERMSTVIGHSHSFGGCKYSANKRDLIFGLNVGCGIDIAAYAFAYGKHAKYRPTLGCGIVLSNSNALFVPMSGKYFRD